MSLRQTATATALAALASLLLGCHHAPPPGPPPALPVETMPLVEQTIDDASEYVATLKSRRSVEIMPDVEGWVTRIFVRSGDRATSGTPLFQIDPRQQHAAVMSAQATRHSRMAALTYAAQSYERTKKLFRRGFVSHDDLDHARATLDAARQDWNAQVEVVRQEQTQLGYYLVNAPGTGVVGDVPVRLGDRVTTQTVLTTLDENQRLEIYIGIPLERSAQLHLGLQVELYDDAGKQLGRAPIDFVSPRVDNATQSVLAKCDLPNPSDELRNAQLVRARVIWGTRQAVLVPVIAVTRLGGQAFVYVAASEKGHLIARRKPVTLGAILGQSYVVEEGLKAGEHAVVSGLQKLQDGVPIVERR